MHGLSILFRFLLVLTIAFFYGCSQPGEQKIHSHESKVEHTNIERPLLPKLPSSVVFCEVNYPLDNFDIRERLDKEIVVNTFYHSSTIQGLKRANRFFPAIEKVLKENNVPDDFKYLCLIESNLTQARSPAGAMGFWQFMPETAREFGLIVNNQIDERLDIEKSTHAACQYIKKAQNKFKDWMLTAASYNRGMGGISKQLKEQQVDTYFDLYLNNETSRYGFRILAMKLIFENPEAYGFSKKEIELYDPIPTRKIKVNSSIADLKIWAKKMGTTYRMVKILNPWILKDILEVKNETLTIEIPK